MLLDDPHLAVRGFWQWLDRAVVGRQPNPSADLRENGEPITIRAPTPTLGQQNEELLG